MHDAGAVTPRRPHVLWICGPPGVGKTAVAWHLFTDLTRSGIDAAYVDVDQLGICYPDGPDDPGRHRLKTRTVGAAVRTFTSAGSSCVVVSGVVDPVNGVRADLLPDAALTLCRLRVDPEVLRARLAGRGPLLDPLDTVLDEARALDGTTWADIVVDTSALSVDDAAAAVRRRAASWPQLEAEPTAAQVLHGPTGRVVWVVGPPGVGTSSVAWRLYEMAREAGLTAGLIDVDQLGFCGKDWASRPDRHLVKARNLAALLSTYSAAGADCVVVASHLCGDAEYAATAQALATTDMTLCRLHAGPATLAHRLQLRAAGHSWRAPGDQVLGASPQGLAQITAAAVACARHIDRLRPGGVRIDTDGLTLPQTVTAILAHTEWPPVSQGGD